MTTATRKIEKPWALVLAERQGVLLRVSDDGRIGFSSHGSTPAPMLRQKIREAKADIAAWYAQQREIEAEMWRQAQRASAYLTDVQKQQAIAHAADLRKQSPADLDAYRQRKVQQLMELYEEQESFGDDIFLAPDVTDITAIEVRALDLVAPERSQHA